MADEASVWEVDRLAARRVLAELGLAGDAATIERVAAAFCSHRIGAQDWAAQRVRQAMLDTLEAASMREFAHKDAHWADGFRFAEHSLLAADQGALLGVRPRAQRSTGQILRAMVRGAKRPT